MAKRRRGSRVRTGSVWGARQVIVDLEDKLGMGVLVTDTEEGPPFEITALLTFGIQQTTVVVEGPTEVEAWHELARTAVNWRQSNEISLRRTFWGG